MTAHPVPARAPLPSPAKPWELPRAGLSVFYGCAEMPRLVHYFLPRELLAGRQVLCLDGANRFDPLLVARLARQRGVAPAVFNQRLRVARAFTCFQLTELLVRVPRLVEKFPADALVVTALPDLYFDEDVREAAAGASFRRALEALERLARNPEGSGLPVAVFSDATSFHTPRRKFFQQLMARAGQVWRFTVGEDRRLSIACEKALPRKGLASVPVASTGTGRELHHLLP